MEVKRRCAPCIVFAFRFPAEPVLLAAVRGREAMCATAPTTPLTQGERGTLDLKIRPFFGVTQPYERGTTNER